MATVIDEFVTWYLFRVDKTALQNLEKGVTNVKKKLDDSAKSLMDIGRGFTLVGGAAVAAFGAASGAAIKWESDFTDVLKTVNGTEEQLAALETRLREMARNEIPISHSELASMAAAAGQLGIQTDNIDEFVEVIAKLAATTNLVEGGGQELARFANITQMSQGDFDRLGSVVVDLGNNLATTEQEIVDFGLRLAGMGNQVGLSESEILSFGAAASSVGLNAEAGGTAISRVWAEMQKAIQGGTAELETFADVAGFATGQEFGGLFMTEGADDATLRFIAGLRRMMDEGENVHPILETLGFDNIRVRDALLRAAGAEDLFRESLALGSNAWEENNALTREAELRFQTTASQITFLKNKVWDIAITIGDVLVPRIQSAIEWIAPLLDRFQEWIEQHPTIVAVAAGISLAILALGGVFLGLAGIVKFVAFTFGLALGPIRATIALYGFLTSGTLILRAQLFALAVQQKAVAVWARIVKLATLAWTGAQWLLNVALTANPIGIVIMAIAALIAIVALVIVYWDEVVAAVTRVWDILRSFASGMPGWLSIVLGVMMPFIGIPLLIIRHWDRIRGFFSWLWDQVTRIFTAAWDKIGPIVDGVVGGAKAIGGVLGFGGGDDDGSGTPPGAGAAAAAFGAAASDLSQATAAPAGTGIPALGGGQGLPGFQAPLPVAPVTGLDAAGGLGGGPTHVTKEYNVEFGDIIIHAEGSDSKEIGANVSREIRDQIQTAVADLDDDIDR